MRRFVLVNYLGNLAICDRYTNYADYYLKDSNKLYYVIPSALNVLADPQTIVLLKLQTQEAVDRLPLTHPEYFI